MTHRYIEQSRAEHLAWAKKRAHEEYKSAGFTRSRALVRRGHDMVRCRVFMSHR